MSIVHFNGDPIVADGWYVEQPDTTLVGPFRSEWEAKEYFDLNEKHQDISK